MIGGAVEFFCLNNKTRPRKDAWDTDLEDGIISATCYHGDSLSITMNPAGIVFYNFAGIHTPNRGIPNKKLGNVSLVIYFKYPTFNMIFKKS